MIVRGKDVVFLVADEPIACARTASLTTQTDTAETSTLGTGKWKTYRGLKMYFNISAAGLVSYDMNYSIAALRQMQINFSPILFKFFGTDANGKSERYEGEFIIMSISTPTSYNGNLEYSLEGQGTGELTIEII